MESSPFTERLDKGPFRDIFLERRNQGSLLIARAIIVVVLFSIPFTIGNWLMVGSLMGKMFLILEASILVYAGLVIFLCKTGHYHPWYDWINVAVEASLPTFVVLIDIKCVSPEYALTSGVSMGLYNMAIFIACLRFRPRLAIVAGLIAAAELLAVSFLAITYIDPAQIEAIPAVQTPILIQRSVYLLLSGVVAFWLGRSLLHLLRNMLGSAQREMKVISILGRNVAKPIADYLLRSEEKATGGERRVISVMFCDIKSFTEYSDHHGPAETVQLLNKFFTPCWRIVNGYGGVINKFLGDGFMAIFGAPEQQNDHADRVLAAAIDIYRRIDRFRAELGSPAFDLRIGVHSGEAIVGTIGPENRTEYTAIGDTVNLASRIEQLNKQYDTRVLISEGTKDLLEKPVDLKLIDEAKVRGRKDPVKLWTFA